MATYIAYKCGKGNHSFIMQTEQYKTVFEGKLLKSRFFSASDYEFINSKDSTKVLHKIGKTVSKSAGTSNGAISTRILLDSYFKMDGKNVFDVLSAKGYTLKLTNAKLINPEVSLLNGGVVTATLKLNVKGSKQENVTAIGNSQRNIVITTDSTDIESVFLAAFIMSRVQLSNRII